ncbi:hypothetical protein GCM10025734_40870 [Kitasatospora paranensis]
MADSTPDGLPGPGADPLRRRPDRQPFRTARTAPATRPEQPGGRSDARAAQPGRAR